MFLIVDQLNISWLPSVGGHVSCKRRVSSCCLKVSELRHATHKRSVNLHGLFPFASHVTCTMASKELELLGEFEIISNVKAVSLHLSGRKCRTQARDEPN